MHTSVGDNIGKGVRTVAVLALVVGVAVGGTVVAIVYWMCGR